MEKRPVLITGASGFIGGAVASHLLAEGWRVRGMSRNTPDAGRCNGLEYVRGDIRQLEDVLMAAEGCSAIINTATLYQGDSRRPEDVMSANVDGPANVMRAALQSGVRKVVHLSTCGVFSTSAALPLREDSAVDAQSRDIYERSKYLGEQAVRDGMRGADVSLVILRPTMVYGPGDRRLLKLFRLVSARRFFYVGRGENLVQPLFVGDLADCIVKLLDKAQDTRLYVLAGPETARLKDWVETISSCLSVRPPGVHVPVLPMAVLADVSERISKWIGVSPPIYEGRLDFFRRNTSCDMSLVREETGWQPRVGLAEGAVLTIEWYRRLGWL